MALTTTSTITAKVEWVTIDTQRVSSRLTDAAGINLVSALANGTGVDEVNYAFATEITLNSGQSYEFDLTSLTTQIFGSSITVDLTNSVVKAFAIKNLSTGILDAIQVTFTGASPWTNLLGAACTPTIKAENYLMMTDTVNGIAVTTGNKNFEVTDVNGTGPTFAIGLVCVTGL